MVPHRQRMRCWWRPPVDARGVHSVQVVRLVHTTELSAGVATGSPQFCLSSGNAVDAGVRWIYNISTTAWGVHER